MPALTGTMVTPQNKLTASVAAMSDAVAAPVPTRSVPLRKPTSSEVASKIVAGLGVFALGVVLGGPLLYFGWTVAGTAALIFFGGGGLLVMLFSRDEVSACPFCGRRWTTCRSRMRMACLDRCSAGSAGSIRGCKRVLCRHTTPTRWRSGQRFDRR